MLKTDMFFLKETKPPSSENSQGSLESDESHHGPFHNEVSVDGKHETITSKKVSPIPLFFFPENGITLRNFLGKK